MLKKGAGHISKQSQERTIKPQHLLQNHEVLKRSCLMFPRTLNVPPHSTEKYLIIACIISHVAAQVKLYMLIACVFFEIASKTMHTEELAAASPPPTLLYVSTLMRFRTNTCY